MEKPWVCITGASGGIGQSLLPVLVERYQVKALFRQRTDLTRKWETRGCRIVLGDLNHEPALRELVEGARLVFHCAAKVTGFSAREFFHANVTGTSNLARLASAARCQRFVHLSSIAVYLGAVDEAAPVFTEDLPLRLSPDMDAYSASKLQSEQRIREIFAGGATEYTILRPTCVYGARIRSWTLIPLGLLEKNRTILLGLDEGAGLMDAVHVDDVVAGIMSAAEAPAAAGQIFNLGNETVSFREFYSFLGRMTGRSPRFSSELRLRRFQKLMRSTKALPKSVRESLATGLRTVLWLSLNHRPFPSGKAAKDFGYRPRLTLPVAMLRTELALRDAGRLPAQAPGMPNADRHYVVSPRAVARPKTETDLIELVKDAAQHRLKLKAIGALHSFVPIPKTDGICLVLDQYRALLAATDSTVTVQAGITITELNRVLAERGRALSIHGSHTAQTVAGAIGTATHGGSLHHGTLSDCVERIRLIKPNGDVVELDRTEPLFPAVVVSLGLLGVVSTVTLRCRPQFYLRSVVAVKSLAETLRHFDAVQRENEYVDLCYYPQPQLVELFTINPAERPSAETTNLAPGAVAPSAGNASAAGTAPVSPARQRMVSRVFRLLLRTLAATRSETLHRQVVTRFIGQFHRPQHGFSDRVLTFTDLAQGEPFPIDDLEFAIPYADAKTALQALADHFGRARDYPRFFPVHIRCSPGGEHWLSPNYRRDTCWLEFWHYPPSRASYVTLERILRPFAYRYHWAKLCATSEYDPASRFERFAEFVQLRRQWDAQGMLLNDYLARWFA